MTRLTFPLIGALALSGCTVVDVVTLPVKVAKTGVDAVGAGVDAVTTSQSEADQKRGKQIRQREEKVGKLERAFAKQTKKCDDGDEEACAKAAGLRAEIDALLPGLPYEGD
ncbi:MAG TPA: hypothetical protein VM055_00855 [Novosphingobium sp.]|nr:hypothetical protein [Novosphingobium sp.]